MESYLVPDFIARSGSCRCGGRAFVSDFEAPGLRLVEMLYLGLLSRTLLARNTFLFLTTKVVNKEASL